MSAFLGDKLNPLLPYFLEGLSVLTLPFLPGFPELVRLKLLVPLVLLRFPLDWLVNELSSSSELLSRLIEDLDGVKEASSLLLLT